MMLELVIAERSAPLMTHEFGHPFGLGHLDDAIMSPVYQNTIKGRDVFHADIECTRQVIGERQTAGYARLIENGALTNESPYTAQLPVANSAVGMGNLAGTPRWTSVNKDTFGLFWLEDFVAPSFNRLDQTNEDAPGPPLRATGRMTTCWDTPSKRTNGRRAACVPR